MKILFILNAIKDEMAGMTGVILNLGKALQAKGHRVDYIFRDDFVFFRKDSPFRRTIAFIIFPILIFFLISLKKLDRIYDVIDISSGDGFLYGIARNIFKSENRAKLVVRSHGLEHLYWKDFMEEVRLAKETMSLAQRLYLPLMRMAEVKLAMKSCDKVICLNQNEKNYIQTMFGETINVSVVPHGVSDRFFIASKDGRKDLLFVGDWNWRKGRRYLVKIFLSILKKRPQTRFFILVHRNKEKEVIDSLPEYARNRAVILKNLSLEELVELYASHSVFLFPSIFEGFGCVILEAMAAGMPVITTDDFGWNKIIVNWQNGILVPKRDVEGFSRAAIKLLEDEQLRNEIGIKAQKTAANFRWGNIAEQTLLCYEDHS